MNFYSIKYDISINKKKRTGLQDIAGCFENRKLISFYPAGEGDPAILLNYYVFSNCWLF
jgi:hypothetical protein